MKRIILHPMFPLVLFIIGCLIAVVLTLEVLGNWVPEKNLNLQNLGTVWVHEDDCEKATQGTCVLIPQNFDPRYFKASYKKKIDIRRCKGKKNCLAQEVEECSDPSYFRVVARNYQTTYCTKLAYIRLNKDLQISIVKKEKQQQQQRQDNLKSCTTSLAGNTELSNADIKRCFKVLFNR